MATEIQHRFFETLYEQENARGESFIDRGKIYLSIVSIFFGGFLFKLDWIVEHRTLMEPGFWFYVLGAGCFLGSMILLCSALQVLTYEALADPGELIQELDGDQAIDAIFWAARIAEYTHAYSRNSLQNDKRAIYLRGSLAFIVIGVVLLCVGVGIVLASAK